MTNLNGEQKKSHKKLIALIICAAVLVIAGIFTIVIISSATIKFDIKMDGDICKVTIKGRGELEYEQVDTLYEDPQVVKANEIHIEISNGITKIPTGMFSTTYRVNEDSQEAEERTIKSSGFYGKITKVVIPESVKYIDGPLFSYVEQVVVYCEAKSKPSDWQDNWDYLIPDRSDLAVPVVWDYKNNDIANDGYIYTKVDGIVYGIRDGEATVSSQRKTLDTPKIKETIEYNGKSYVVTAISDNAFYGCSNLKSVDMPDSIIRIGDNAFSNCYLLENVVLPSNLTELGYSAFPTIHFLKHNEYENAFYLASKDNPYFALMEAEENISEITINEQTKIIADGAFSYARITSVIIPDEVITIGDEAFYGCSALEKVIMGENVTTIGERAFNSCASLKTVVMFPSLLHIEKAAFQYCNNLDNIILPKYLISIGDYAFEGCTQLTSALISSSFIMDMGASVFENCPSVIIFCAEDSKPKSWGEEWNGSDYHVVWGYNGN